MDGFLILKKLQSLGMEPCHVILNVLKRVKQSQQPHSDRRSHRTPVTKLNIIMQDGTSIQDFNIEKKKKFQLCKCSLSFQQQLRRKHCRVIFFFISPKKQALSKRLNISQNIGWMKKICIKYKPTTSSMIA